jgi:hypothetical protein
LWHVIVRPSATLPESTIPTFGRKLSTRQSFR